MKKNISLVIMTLVVSILPLSTAETILEFQTIKISVVRDTQKYKEHYKSTFMMILTTINPGQNIV